MCAENYALGVKPDRNWKPLFEKLWAITGDMYWDEWADRVIEVIPEYLYEFDNYQASDFEYLTEDEYDVFVALNRDMPREWNTLLKRIRDMEDIYVYTDIPGDDAESIEFLKEIVGILDAADIQLPDSGAVAFSESSEVERIRYLGHKVNGERCAR